PPFAGCSWTAARDSDRPHEVGPRTAVIQVHMLFWAARRSSLSTGRRTHQRRRCFSLNPRSKDAPPLLAQLQPDSRAVASRWDHSDQVTREAWQAAIATSEVRLRWDPDHAQRQAGGPVRHWLRSASVNCSKSRLCCDTEIPPRRTRAGPSDDACGTRLSSRRSITRAAVESRLRPGMSGRAGASRKSLLSRCGFPAGTCAERSNSVDSKHKNAAALTGAWVGAPPNPVVSCAYLLSTP